MPERRTASPEPDAEPPLERAHEDLLAENLELRARLEEAEEALRAIREGEVDAVIVSGSKGDRVFSLTETENLHRLMVETMDEAGLAISAEGLLLYANDRAGALLERGRSQLLGHPIEELVASGEVPRLRRLLEASHRGTADDRIVFRKAGGAEVPMHLWANRLPRPGEAMICLVGTDLTRIEADRALLAELREHQQALQASRAEALKLMSEALLAREEAAQLAQELREGDRRKDAFLATLAHELRNPLAPIRNALETLRRASAGDPEVLMALAIVDRQFSHLVRLLDDLLDISRITCGTIDLHKEPVELSAIIATAVETVQPLIEAAGQRLTITPASQPIWLEADPIRLEQVFANLLNNATKYTGDGGDIRLVVEPLDGAVQIAVGDSGVGIRAELLPHVFELFRRDLAVPGRDKGGLGIGLSLVRRLTELHGGHVEARSAGPGAGSEFCVRLPVLSASPRRMPDPTLSRSRPTCPLPAGCRIMIVDDNQDAADSLGSLLAGQGGQVDIAYDGPAALARIEERRPDVIVLDIGMPGMDGHEVARRIRARTDLPQPTLIALSGLGQHADRQRSRKAGFDYHLVKPVPIDVLESLLAAGWRRRHPGRWTATSSAPGAALEQAVPGAPAGPCDAPPEDRRAVSPAAVADVAAGQSMPSPGPQMAVRPPALGYEVPAATGDSDRLRPVDSALLHDLAQPLNTIACYAVAARGLAAKSAADPTPLTKALRGIDQQILRAGAALDRLRALLTDLPDADADTGADPLRRAAADPDECVPGR